MSIDKDTQEYRCIVCEKVVNNYGECRANINKFHFGYGSRHDSDTIDVTICDDCIDEKHKKGIVGNFHTNFHTNSDGQMWMNDMGEWDWAPNKEPYEPPTCKELGSIQKLTQAKRPGARDGHKSKI